MYIAKSQGKAAIYSTDTHYITTKKKVNSRVQSSATTILYQHIYFHWYEIAIIEVQAAQHQFPFFVKSVKVKIIEVVGNKSEWKEDRQTELKHIGIVDPRAQPFCWILDPTYISRMNQVFRFVDKKCLHTLISWW